LQWGKDGKGEKVKRWKGF